MLEKNEKLLSGGGVYLARESIKHGVELHTIEIEPKRVNQILTCILLSKKQC